MYRLGNQRHFASTFFAELLFSFYEYLPRVSDVQRRVASSRCLSPTATIATDKQECLNKTGCSFVCMVCLPTSGVEIRVDDRQLPVNCRDPPVSALSISKSYIGM